MTWVTWRQHRLEGAWALALTALLAACIGYVAYVVWKAASDCGGGAEVGLCLPDNLSGQVAQWIVKFDLFQYGLVVLPALAGAFIGAPLVAREIENGTQHLAWTQGVTRLRWLSVKLVLVFVPLLLAAALVGCLEIVLINVQGANANRWAFFDQQAPVTVAATFFALALGVAAGAVVRRSIPAMAATLIGFVVVRILLGVLARPNYMPPVRFVSHDLSTFGGNPTGWFVDSGNFYDSAGHLLSTGGPSPGMGPAFSYYVQNYQPADRFWVFQSIESAILSGLAILLLGFAIYWVTRRT